MTNIAIKYIIIVSVVGIILPVILSSLVVINYPPALEVAVRWVFNELWRWDFLLPISTMFYLLFVYITLEASFMFVYLTIAVWRFFAGSSS